MYMYNLQHSRFSVEQLIHACVYKTVTMNGVVHDIENVLLVSLASLPSHTAGVIFYIYTVCVCIRRCILALRLPMHYVLI